MFVYRIVKTENRIADISGMGAFKAGGRWNSKGTYMLYTSETSSLAYLETLVHFEGLDYPPDLYVMRIEIAKTAPVYTLPDAAYPVEWKEVGQVATKILGDRLMTEKRYLGIKVKSAVNEFEYNYLLNPLFPGFHELVKIVAHKKVYLDERLIDQVSG